MVCSYERLSDCRGRRVSGSGGAQFALTQVRGSTKNCVIPADLRLAQVRFPKAVVEVPEDEKHLLSAPSPWQQNKEAPSEAKLDKACFLPNKAQVTQLFGAVTHFPDVQRPVPQPGRFWFSSVSPPWIFWCRCQEGKGPGT